jgi:hypothetical protein
MHYPLIFETDSKGYIKRTTKALMEKEMNESRFLGQEFPAFDSYYPRGCFRHKYKRNVIAITPRNEFTSAIERNIYSWSKCHLTFLMFLKWTNGGSKWGISSYRILGNLITLER